MRNYPTTLTNLHKYGIIKGDVTLYIPSLHQLYLQQESWKFAKEVFMKLENTVYSNYKLVIDEFDIPVAVQVNGEIEFRLYDEVHVKGDCRGHICPGITQEGLGTIVRIRRDRTDYFFGVLMNNGQFGYMKDSRMSRF